MRSLFHSQTRRLSLPGLSEAAVGTQIVRYLFILRIIFLNFIVNDKIFLSFTIDLFNGLLTLFRYNGKINSYNRERSFVK